MSNLKRDIEELLEDMPNAWCVDCEHPICLDKKELATTQIINLIESVIPEPEDARKIDKGNEAYYDQAEGFRLGWTHALTIIKSKLIGGSNGTEYQRRV